MGVGSTVTALLETYSNCLALLKAFKRRGGDAGRSDDKQSLLRRSIRSDRAKVRRAYSTRLSERGARLEKGDGTWQTRWQHYAYNIMAYLTSLHQRSSEVGPAADSQEVDQCDCQSPTHRQQEPEPGHGLRIAHDLVELVTHRRY